MQTVTYVCPQVIEIGKVTSLTLLASGGHGGGKPGDRVDGGGTLTIVSGNQGNGSNNANGGKHP